MEDNVIVSICCLAYNHEKYIRQTLDGFLCQKTNFKYEILIHDDASTDGTADIIREYEEKYPDLIKPIYQVENKGSKGERITYDYQFTRVNGKYVALCEGDDYWTNPNKLQMQYDSMQQHEECVFCAHKVRVINEDGSLRKSTYPANEIDTGIIKQEELMDFIANKEQYIFQTSSYFFESKYLKEIVGNLPQFMSVSKVCDTPLVLFYIAKGDFFYINEEMSCYRFQSVGSWNSRLAKALDKQIDNYKRNIRSMECYDDYTCFQYSPYIKQIIKHREFQLFLLTKQYKKILEKKYRDNFKRLGKKERIYIRICRVIPGIDVWYMNVKQRFRCNRK